MVKSFLGLGPTPAISATVVPPSAVPSQFLGPNVLDLSLPTNIPDPQVFSQESGFAPFETLFHEFELEAIPYYNFWAADEETNDHEERGGRALEEIPRYVRVIWEQAPNLREPGRSGLLDVTKRVNERGAKLGLEIISPRGIISKGVLFSPRHLRDFSLILRSLANGFMAPGVVSSVVELPLKNAMRVGTSALSSRLYSLDENSFLTHPSFDGISLPELISNIHSLTNGVTAASRVTGGPISDDRTRDKGTFFDGTFSVEKSFQGGAIRFSALAASSPAIGFDAMTATSSEPLPKAADSDAAFSMAELIAPPAPAVSVETSAFTKVGFVDSAIAGIILPEKVNMISKPEHAENTLALAQFLPNLEVLSTSDIQSKREEILIPSFPSPAELKRLEYIGYVVEKYKKNQGGAFELVEEIKLPSREYDEYIDTKVVYGGVYRYRIRAILRWTRPSKQEVLGISPVELGSNQTQTKPLSSYKSSYFGSEWNKKWTYAAIIDAVPPPPPDELSVRTESAKKLITVTLKFPYNPQQDIWFIRIFRKVVDQTGKDVSEWAQIGSDFSPQNVIFFDDAVEYFQDNGGLRYVYTAQCVSRHYEFSVLSVQLAARLNKGHQYSGEFPIEFISQEGVRLEHHGAFAVNPPQRYFSEVLSKETFSLKGRESRDAGTRDDVTYFLRIESLDTGERRDFELNVDYNNVDPLVEKTDRTVFVDVAALKGGKILQRRSPAKVQIGIPVPVVGILEPLASIGSSRNFGVT